MAALPANLARGDLQDQKVAGYQSPLGVTRTETVTLPGLRTQSGFTFEQVDVAYQTLGTLSPARDNAILVCPALTGDAHVAGTDPHTGRPGWWDYHVGPGKAIDPGKFFVICASVLGGCGGTTGPASPRSGTGKPYAMDFPPVTVRDMVSVQIKLLDHLRIPQLFAAIGGSMGGMQALEWAVAHPERVERFAVLAAPPISSADQIALNSVQNEAIRMDPGFAAGEYYDAADGHGPHRGLALARRMALLNYRSPTELNDRFERSWQSGLSPLGGGGLFAVESYLGFHGNKFTRRFDANSYLVLTDAMNSHDIGRDRGGVASALARATSTSLVLGIDSDRLFPVPGQQLIARHLPGNIDGDMPVVLSSPFGHDAFLIEDALVGAELRRLLAF